MKTKLKYFGLCLILIGLYLFGYVMGQTAQHRSDTKSQISFTLNLYKLADMGLCDRLKDRLAFRVYGNTKSYQILQRNRFYYFPAMLLAGEPSGASWERTLAEATAFADRYQTNVVILDKQKLIDDLNRQQTNQSGKGDSLK